MRRTKTEPTIFESQLYLESFWKNVQRSDVQQNSERSAILSREAKALPEITHLRKRDNCKNRSGVGDADAAAAILEAAARPIPPKKSRLQTFSSVICVLCSSQHKQDSLENVF